MNIEETKNRIKSLKLILENPANTLSKSSIDLINTMITSMEIDIEEKSELEQIKVAINVFERVNNCSIYVNIYCDGSYSVQEFFSDNVLGYNLTTLKQLLKYLTTAKLEKTEDGRTKKTNLKLNEAILTELLDISIEAIDYVGQANYESRIIDAKEKVKKVYNNIIKKQ